jgi:hypothetical protein
MVEAEWFFFYHFHLSLKWNMFEMSELSWLFPMKLVDKGMEIFRNWRKEFVLAILKEHELATLNVLPFFTIFNARINA